MDIQFKLIVYFSLLNVHIFELYVHCKPQKYLAMEFYYFFLFLFWLEKIWMMGSENYVWFMLENWIIIRFLKFYQNLIKHRHAIANDI